MLLDAVRVLLAFPSAGDGEDAKERATPTRMFSWRDVTSGLPDDSREGDERQEALQLKNLRGRMKRARAIAACTPGLVEVLASDWKKAARFYARFGITEGEFRHGVPTAVTEQEVEIPRDLSRNI